MSAPGFLFSQRLRRQFGEAQERRAAVSKVSDDEWAGLQLAALKLVWADACADVPYYGDVVAKGLAPAEIRSWQDVRSIPILTREAFQTNLNCSSAARASPTTSCGRQDRPARP